MGDPLVLDVTDLLRAPGVRHSHTLGGSVPEVELPSARMPAGAEVDVDMVLEAQGSDVIVEGTIHAPWVGECRRCLEETSGEVEAPFREVYSEDPVEGETFGMHDQRLDLRPMVRETLALALPLAPLCRKDCPGPDPDAHPVGPSGTYAETPEAGEGQVSGETEGQPVDERWAVLDQLHLDD